MSNLYRYDKWSSLTNPVVGTFTNSLVNFNNGVYILQSTASPLHTIPDGTIDGKIFGVGNAESSSHNISIQVPLAQGLTSFTILPGETAIFRWMEVSGVWAEESGATVIASIATGGGVISFTDLIDAPHSYVGSGGYFIQVKNTEDGLQFTPTSASAGVGSLTRTINYNDTADSGSTIFNIGILPVNARVDRVSIQIITPFNDPVGNLLNIIAANGYTDLFSSDLIDLHEGNGVFIQQVPATQISNGLVTANFNASPQGSGGTAGSLSIVVQYIFF